MSEIKLASYVDKIKKVEPPCWWIGFENQVLQLLIYGENLAHFHPFVNYDHVSVLNVHRTENANYLFLDLKIGEQALEGTLEIILSNDRSRNLHISYPLIERRHDSASRNGFDSSDLIYLINPDRFSNGDPSIDRTHDTLEKPNRKYKYGRHGGDIQGIINHLDYIKDMGFTAIWPTPLLENNMPEQSYHGYAITDFYRIDPRYGNLDKYLELCESAKILGLKVIKDMVLNHCGSKHWWLHDLPAKDWINTHHKYTETNHRREVFQDIHASEFDKKQMTDGWFVDGMPDLNQRNKFLAIYLFQNAIWWIETAGLAGIRVDTYPYLDPDFSTEWCRKILLEYPNLNIVGEEWSYNPAITSYWQKGKINANGYVSNLPSVMDFPFQDALVKGLNSPLDNVNEGLGKVYQAIANDFLYANPNNILTFADNHDMNRFYTSIHENLNHYKMGIVMLATMRGIPQIYYGTEILMANPKSESHGVIRADFPGGWMGDKINAFTGEGLNGDQNEAQAFCKWLFHLRKKHAVFHFGKMMHFAPYKGIYAWIRYNESEKILVILNHAVTNKKVNLNRYAEIIDLDKPGFDLYAQKTINLHQELSIAGKGFCILQTV